MSKKQQTISPLRQRMIDEMNLRKLAVGMQKQYIRAVRKLADFLDFSPAQATAEDLRDFQVYLADIGTSKCTINMTLTGLSFFYREVFDQGEIMKRVRYVRQERKLPVILNREEMAQLIHAAGNNRDRAALSVAYGAGLRVSEVVKLKTTDIDSKRMAIRVEQGKGSRDRYAMLSPVLLEILRRWWREGHKQGVIPKGGWLFPSRNHSPFNHISKQQLGRICKKAVKTAGIEKRVSMHTLRHSFATHLLEDKVDIRLIQVLLGHKKIETTSQYTQVATNLLKTVTSPLDRIDIPTS